ncbi:hypothetical protein UNDKW_5089 [Undibacterium sp. KW1]|uniref:hypothetical protein n=1 Tax=Undibacterium sp. KW1 TaxID=2058624 RepID=UPI001331F7DD|nr:hypothetical protein [Undibacterium sp. KW1]BBB63362.1 hypothetical protein UNDKW_5089 [Undibacterium sp. KW1]
MKYPRNLLSILVSSIFATGFAAYAPVALAGFEVVSNSNTPYVYQISGAQRKVVDVREERVVGATANTLHHGHIDMDMVMIPVAANKGVDMLTGLRGIVPESQGWRVFALKGVNLRNKIEWNSAQTWVIALDGVLLKHKLIADINWESREITLAPMSNRNYASQLLSQGKDKSILRHVTVRQQFETPEPLIALRLQPAHAAITEARAVPIASVDVPVRALGEVGDNRGSASVGVKVTDGTIDSMINQRVEQATREKMAQLEALEAQYREKLEQLNARSQQVKPEPSSAPQDATTTKPVAQPISFEDGDAKPTSATRMMRADYRFPRPAAGGYRMSRMDLPAAVAGADEAKPAMTKARFAAAEAQATSSVVDNNVITEVATTTANSSVISFPVQANVEVQEASRTKWEISLNDKTLRNALLRLASKNGYSLSYQTKDQDIKMGGTFFGTFDGALREIEIATGKRIRQVESRLLGRLIIVTD